MIGWIRHVRPQRLVTWTSINDVARLGVEALAEARKPLLVARVGDDALQLRQSGPQAEHLALGLPARADHAERLRPRLRQVAGCNGARSTGAELSELVGLDERQHLGVIHREEDDDVAHTPLRGGIGLQAGDAEFEVRGRHDVQRPGIEAQAEAGTKLDPPARQPPEAALDGLDRVFDVLRAVVPDEPTNWSRRYKANLEKLHSGDVMKVAEVVRDLWRRERDRGLSAGEKRMLAKARQILVSELALCEHTNEDKAETLLDEVLAS